MTIVPVSTMPVSMTIPRPIRALPTAAAT
jgi:hypothetical protein